MTPEEADKAQNWLGMDGATAWHLIDRHADNWNEVGELMNSWLRANVLAEREACAKACEDFDFNKREEIEPPRTLPRYCAAAIRKRSNAELRGAKPIGEASLSNDVLGADAPERN